MKPLQKTRWFEEIVRGLRGSFSHSKLYLWEKDYTGDALVTGDVLKTHRFRREDLDDRFRAYRDKQQLEERLNAGFIGYWFEYEGTFVHAHWYALTTNDIWDIRSKLIIPHGSLYLFDVHTVTEYRGQRFFRSALRSSFSDMIASGGKVYAITKPKNTPANMAFSDAGFERCASISFWQMPPFRYHAIQTDVRTERHMRLMYLGNPHLAINLGDIRLVSHNRVQP